MTRDEILAMQPGRELDVVVAEALGATNVRFIDLFGWGDYFENDDLSRRIRKHSTEVSDSFEAIDKVRERTGKRIQITELPEGWKGRWSASYGNDRKNEVVSDNLAEAICKAALIALKEGESQ